MAKPDNKALYDAIWDHLETRYGEDFAKTLEDDAYGDVDEMIWRFIDEVIDTCARGADDGTT